MPHADFVHLRVHSAYSLSEGAIKVKELVKLCLKQKMPAAAVTDAAMDDIARALVAALAALPAQASGPPDDESEYADSPAKRLLDR